MKTPPPLARLHPSLPLDAAAAADPARGLRIATLVWAGLWLFGLLMNNVIAPIVSPDEPLDDAWPFPATPVALAAIAMSLGLNALTRRRTLPPERLVNLALLYEVALALGIGIVNQWTPNPTGLSWICVLILVHPLVIAAPPGKTLLAALAAASMDLVGLAITAARGVEIMPVDTMIWTYIPNFLCAGLAVIPARVRRKLEEQRAQVRELGSYRLGEELGRGGMGAVYRAEHRMLVRPAAVKLVSPELLGARNAAQRAEIVARFQREAKVTAALRSPHTVQVYDYGVAYDGTLYYVMELLDGFDLHTFVRRFGPMLPARAVHVLRHACDSLGEAHAYGLIHRDVKPGNICLCRYGRRVDFAKVLDFGLAKATDVAAVGAHVTAEESVPGTPAVMAPERIRGGVVGPASDLYSLGCVAYWLVTGELVFEGDSAMEVLAQHAKAVPEPPSRRTELEIPAALDAAILACLEKDPARRPPSADALSETLKAVETAEPWTTDHARHWWEVHGPEAGQNPQQLPTLPV